MSSRITRVAKYETGRKRPNHIPAPEVCGLDVIRGAQKASDLKYDLHFGLLAAVSNNEEDYAPPAPALEIQPFHLEELEQKAY